MTESARLIIAVDSRQVGQADSALNSLGRTSSTVATAVKGVAAAFGVRELYQATEAYASIANRMRLVTESAVELRAAQDAVFQSAQTARQPLAATAELYQRIAANQKALNLSGKGVASITDTISKSLAISGASAASANAALIQLGQAFASGTLRGEELNSVMEQAPALSQAIAAGMGVTVGQLRSLGAEGKLTAEAVVKALQDQADAVDEKFSRIATTIGGSLQVAGNTLTRFVGEFDQATGTTAAFANGIIGASKIVDTFTGDADALASTVKNVGAVMGGVGAASAVLLASKLGTALYASRAAKAANIAQAESAVNAARANQIAAQSAVVRAEREALAARGTAVQTQMSIQLAQARMAEAGATTALGGAQATLRTASAGLLSVLGGPVGLALLVGTMAASYFLFRDGANAATSALIDQNGTLDDSIQKFKELSAEQQRFQSSKWVEAQESALDSASSALAEYATRGSQAFNSLGMSGVESAEAFSVMVAEVKAGTRTLDSVTEWVAKNNQIMPAFKSMLEQTAAAYSANGEKAEKYGKLLAQSSGVTTSATTETEKLAAAQKAAAESSGAKAGEWDKYIAKLTETRDLLGSNAAAEAEYNAAKMGANAQQVAQAKLIGDQTDTLKKYQDAIKEGDKVQQASLKLQLVALYTAEDAATQAAATQSKAYADTATAAENSARRQITAVEQAANFAVASATRVAMGASAPQANLSGYGLLTNGGTAPAAPVVPKATPGQRAQAAIDQLNATTDANKRVDKAANAAATALKNQQKALEDLLATSAISAKSSNAMADAYLAGADNVRELAIQQKIEEELLKTGAGARDAVTAAVNREADAKDRLDIDQLIASMRTETTNTLAQATATLQGADALETFNIKKSMTVALAGRNIEVGSKEYQLLLDQTKAQLDANKALEQANSIEGIVDRLNPQIKLLRDYTKEQEALNAAIASGTGDTALYQDTLAKLALEYEQNKNAATAWGQFTEGAVDRVDDAFADAWKNIDKGFKGFADSLKDGFKQLLAELAHMAITKPIIMQIGASLGVGGLSAQSSGLFGGSSGGGSSLDTMFSAGKSIYSAASSGFGSAVSAGWSAGEGFLGGMQGAISNGSSYISSGLSGLFGSGGVSAASSMAAGASQAGYTGAAMSSWSAGQNAAASATSYGPGLSAISGAIMGYQNSGFKGAAAGAAGGYAGAQAGATVGTYFGPIGTAVGAVIGGMLGAIGGSKLFGGEWQTKDKGFSLGVEDGDFAGQQFEYQKKKGGLFSSNKKRTRLSALDPDMQAALDATYDATESSVLSLFDRLNVQLNDGVLDGLNVAATKISTKGKTGEEIQEAITKWFGGVADSMVSAVDAATGAGLGGFNFERLTTFVNNLYSVNDAFTMLGLKLYDVSVSTGFMAEQLVAMAGGAEAFNAANSKFFDSFYTDVEKTNYTLATVTKQFKAMDVALPGSRAAFRSVVDALDLTTESGRKMYVTLTGLAESASQAYTILEQRLMSAATNAQGAVQRAISAQQKKATEAYNATNTSLNDMVSTVTENVNGLNSVSTSLSTALKALRGDSDDAVKMLRAQAQATLQSALATARSGKSLSGFTGLEDALDTVSNNNTDLYGSMEDFARDQGRTANVVAELNAINGKQLTSAEASLAGLKTQIDLAKAAYDAQMAQYDQQLEFAQAQMDALNGVDNSVMGVTAAINAMNAAVVAALAGVGTKPSANTPQNNATIVDTLYQSVLGRGTKGDEAGAAFWAAQLQSGAMGYDQIAKAIAQGAMGNSAESAATKANAGKYLGIPGYATGGDFGGGLRLVGENGPELEVTGPSRIFNANQTSSMLRGGDSGATAAEVRALREEIKSNASYMARLTKGVADGIDTLVNSGVQINGTVETKAAA